MALPTASPNLGVDVHPSHRAQIALLKAEEALIAVPSEYADFGNVFSPHLAAKLPEHIGINGHPIDLINGQAATL